MDNRLDNVVIFQYETNEFGNPVGGMDFLVSTIEMIENNLPHYMRLIILPKSCSLKTISGIDLSDKNKELLIEILDSIGEDDK